VHASAAKAAVDSVTRSLALEWGDAGVRVVGVAPGPIAGTAGLSKLAPGEGGRSMEEVVRAAVPLGRLGEKGDIALACVFLASGAARWGRARRFSGGSGLVGRPLGSRWEPKPTQTPARNHRPRAAAPSRKPTPQTKPLPQTKPHPLITNPIPSFTPPKTDPPNPERYITGETLVVDGGAWLHRPQLVPREMVSAVSRGVESRSRAVGVAARGGGGGAGRSKL
jgi:NAD(P)-dependent dehydrogenase (short-subunit alcohol dehydrogenase family)